MILNMIYVIGPGHGGPGIVLAASRKMRRRVTGCLWSGYLARASSGSSLTDIAIEQRFADASGSYLQSNNGKLVRVLSSKAPYDELRPGNSGQILKRLSV